MTPRLLVVLACASMVLSSGCGDERQIATCVPGASVVCACPGGRTGAQTCTASGTYAACVCAAPRQDAGGLGGGGAGGQTSAALDAGGLGGTSGTTAPPGSGGTGGQGGFLADSGMGGTGGTTGPSTSSADASIAGIEAGGQVPAADTRPGVEVSRPDVPAPMAVCGDGVVLPPEKCDDGNTMPFDGCSADCRIEPSCSGASCTSKCGDGLVIGEDCDDGNTTNGDGCSSVCTVEDGWACAQGAIGEQMLVPAVFRDFRFRTPSDFEAGVTGGASVAFTGMVKPSLDAEGKPAFTGISGAGAHVESATTFATWYRNVDGVNHSTATNLVLWKNGSGAYVNRYRPDGKSWYVTEAAYFCGVVGNEQADSTTGGPIPCTSIYGTTDCDQMEAQGYRQLPGSCHAESGTYKAEYIVAEMDGNPLFFPIDGDPFSADQLSNANVFPPYASGYPYDLDALGNKVVHNFSFTTELRYWFKYDVANPHKLDFLGDNDLWVFINRRLALDLGGVHAPVAGSLTLDATAAAQFALSDGLVYEISVFHAERQTSGSGLQVTLPGFNMAGSVCRPL